MARRGLAKGGATVRLVPNWRAKLALIGAVGGGAERLASAIAKEARNRTVVGATGAARDSIQVIRDGRDVYVAGGVGDGWYFVFQEVSGRGFRPPPMPIRRAAAKYGRNTNG